MKKRLIWAGLAVVVALGVVLAIGGSRKTEAKYRTARADRGDVTQTVTATGSLSAVTTVQVGSQVSGIISALHADFNKQVRKGDPLAELDPTPFLARIEQNAAALEKTRVEQRNADINLRRQRTLREQGLAPEADFDQAQAAYDSARASVQQAEGGLKQARTDLSYSRIVAPVDGVVVARQYDVGQTVAASFQAPTLFTIAQDLAKMQVSADVSESDIGGIEVGQPAGFTVDAYPDRVFRGKVGQIRLNATVNQNVVTYPVIIEVSNPDHELRPSMTANVTIDVKTARGVLRVPNAALRWKPEERAGATDEQSARGAGEGGTAAMARQLDRTSGVSRRRRAGQTVYVLPVGGVGEPRPAEVRTGISDGRFTQVVEGGVQPGDTVVVGLVTARANVTGVPPGGAGIPGRGRRGF